MNISRRQLLQGASLTGLGLLAGCGPLPLQQPRPTGERIYRVGYLAGSSAAVDATALDSFRQALGALGYLEGRNLVIDSHIGVENRARLPEFAAELVRLPVDILVVPSGDVASIAHEVTGTLPIVLAGSGDLVAAGLAASYARPGGNVTGTATLAEELAGKRLQLLKEAVPSIARVAVFWEVRGNGRFPAETYGRDARAVGVELYPLEVRGPEEFDAAFEAAAQAGADALIRDAGPLGSASRERIVEQAAWLGWPAIYEQRAFVEAGGLMAYGASQTDRWQRAAALVDKILKGANPADIPIEQPMKFDFVINLKTAQALGLTIPQHVLLQATEVLQ